ncbi:MAG TPA: hypothetical protein VN222_17735 [Novosphingobium sp.]|nr:hypothetical protein [Novosphingobium sp.]
MFTAATHRLQCAALHALTEFLLHAPGGEPGAGLWALGAALAARGMRGPARD